MQVARDRQPIGGEDRRKITPINESLQSPNNGVIQAHLLRVLDLALLSYCHDGTWHLVGMSAACRVPLRAFANPATALGQTPKSLISGASFHTIAKSSHRQLPVSRTNTAQLWNPSKSQTKPLSAFRGQCYSTSRSKSGLSSNKGKRSGYKGQTSSSTPLSRKPIKYLIVLGLLGVGAVAFSDEVKHVYGAAARSGRVVGTLAVCMNE